MFMVSVLLEVFCSPYHDFFFFQERPVFGYIQLGVSFPLSAEEINPDSMMPLYFAIP